jgi:hypothetical protein
VIQVILSIYNPYVSTINEASTLMLLSLIRTFCPKALLAVALVYASNLNALTLEAYASAVSVAQGSTIQVMVSTDGIQFKRTVYRVVGAKTTVKTQVYGDQVFLFPGNLQNTNADAYKNGAGWQPSFSYPIPSTWESGVYAFRLTPVGSGGGTGTPVEVHFIVKSTKPKKDVLVIDTATTDNAYNAWGGKSLYDDTSSSGVAANTVSFLRAGDKRVTTKLLEFSAWAVSKGFTLDFASMLDLHNDPNLLTDYKTVVFPGHNEYWTKEMRQRFDAYIENGGHAMILSGNTMWWQIRIDGSTMVAYKSKSATDPYNAIDPSQVTGHFNPAENSSTGLSYKSGGYINYASKYMAANGYGGYKVTDSTHWIYSGTGLNNDDTFGQSTTIAGYEVDGLEFTYQNGVPTPTGRYGSPLNFKILAMADAYNTTTLGVGHATMGIFTKGFGSVFNAATIDWSDGLWSTSTNSYTDSNVSKITFNVLSSFIAGSDVDLDGVVDSLDNCPENSNTNQLNTDGDTQGDACDLDDDNDGVADTTDAFPLNNSESLDTDHDGIGNSADLDDDNDDVADTTDAFPLNNSESLDTDHDGIGNNADLDDDNDDAADTADAFPLDSSESADTDHDGIGNNADPDDDNNGIPDINDTNSNFNKGDVNGDASINAVDIYLLEKHLSGARNIAPDEIIRADIYPPPEGDGAITAQDLLLLQALIK